MEVLIFMVVRIRHYMKLRKRYKKIGIETEVFQVGSKSVRGCIGCGKCRESGKCIF